MVVGIDLAQFVGDPYRSGIQRVLQYLAREWPTDLPADFVVPLGEEFGLLSPAQAFEVVSAVFEADPSADLRVLIAERIAACEPRRVRVGTLISLFDHWLLPEVSYQPEVLHRFALFQQAMPTTMIGYDALPMTNPENYRFAPGANAGVSEYFRLLAGADSVVCISDFARASILRRLRRDPALPISVAHPGGDHVPIREASVGTALLRVGTMEARKQPSEILRAFLEAVQRHGLESELVFVGAPSASDERINDEVCRAVEAGHPVRWITQASDAEVHELIHEAGAFLSIGVEGYGIPVLESIRLGTPVLYRGIQPAAEIMRGRGALPLGDGDLADALARHAETAGSASTDPQAVPTWTDFVHGVAASIRSA